MYLWSSLRRFLRARGTSSASTCKAALPHQRSTHTFISTVLFSTTFTSGSSRRIFHAMQATNSFNDFLAARYAKQIQHGNTEVETRRDRFPGWSTQISQYTNSTEQDWSDNESEVEALRIKSEVDISVLVDPESYFAELDRIEESVHGDCKERRLFTDEGDEDEVSDFSVLACVSLEQIGDFDRIIKELQGTLTALHRMQAKGFCSDHILVFVEADGNSDIIEAVDVGIADVEALVETVCHSEGLFELEVEERLAELLAKFRVMDHSSFDGKKKFAPNADQVRAKLRVTARKRLDDNNAEQVVNGKGTWKMTVIAHLDLLSALLTLSTIIYAGSNCARDDQYILGQQACRVRFDRFATRTLVSSDFSLRSRKLACLDTYIGSRVWVFQKSPISYELAYPLLSIPQFADLWGPVYAVPADEEFGRLLALNVEGGLLYCTADPETPLLSMYVEKNSCLSTGGMVGMHFAPTGTLRRPRTSEKAEPGGACLSLSSEERLPEQLLSFSSAAKMLIGMSPDAQAGPILQNDQQSTGDAIVTASLDSYLDSIPTFGSQAKIPKQQNDRAPEPLQNFRLNEGCTNSLTDFGRDHALELYTLGTHNSYYLPETYQANLGGGQYVSVGFQKEWKKKPASNYKAMLLAFCSKPRTQKYICSILDRKVGFEWSSCTSNGRRVTLFEALKLAFPSDHVTLDRAYASQDGQVVNDFIADLQATGIDHQGRLRLYWPLSEGLPQVLEISKRLPSWSKMLKDSRESACFAVVSNRCWVYESHDTVSNHQWVTSSCTSKDTKQTRRPTFSTTINLQQECQGSVPLNLKQRLRLDRGDLEIRNGQLEGQLAFYSDSSESSFWQAELRKRVRGGPARSANRELLHESNAAKQIVNVCIMDRSPAR